MVWENPLKARLAAGTPVLGCWLAMVAPMAAEIVGLAGYDFVMIDHEHGVASLTETIGLMQAVAAGGAAPLLRVPGLDPQYVKRVLDSGVEGLMFPAISSAEEARLAVAACRYPPEGVRGVALSVVRATRYGLAAERYRAGVADNLLVICQIETLAGVAAIPEIARVPGVDMLFIGPYDLSASLGRLGEFEHPEVQALFNQAEAAILASGAWYGCIPSPVRSVSQLLAVGCRMIIAGSDVGFVRKGAVAEVQAFRALIPSA